ncbi:GntR family transcriptional regulator, partial [Microbispora sp. GKU 823]|uniref:GntR family transcriptional regulator n=1 Tax=Microbispora sp. GKU 823 TaxID=1652100 RepID=UPI00117D38A2
MTPPYARIAAELRRRIIEGELAPGDRVPSTRQVAAQWGVALATATRALAELRREGLVRAEPRVGTVVAHRLARMSAGRDLDDTGPRRAVGGPSRWPGHARPPLRPPTAGASSRRP